MNRYTLFVFGLLFISQIAYSQKVALSDTTWDNWKRASNVTFSEDGSLYYYTISPQAGDPTLFFKKGSLAIDSIERAKRAYFHSNRGVAFTTSSISYDSIRQLKITKTKKSKWPKKALHVIKKDTSIVHKAVTDWGFQLEGNYYYYISNKNDVKYGWSKKKLKAHKKKEVSSEGKTAFITNLSTLESQRYDNVLSIDIPSSGPYAVINQVITVDDSTTYIMTILDMTSGEVKKTYKSGFEFERIVIDYYGRQFGYFISSDTNEHKTYNAIKVDFESLTEDTLIKQADSVTSFKPLFATENSSFLFSKSGDKVYLGLGIQPDNVKRDTLPKDEIPVLDVWSHHDLELQPRQALLIQRELKRTYLSLFVAGQLKLIEDDNWELIENSKDNEGLYYVLKRSKAYEKSYSWSMPWLSDFKVLGENLEKRYSVDQLGYGLEISPKGVTVCYYSHLDSSYVVEDIQSGNKRKFTSHIAEWYQDINGNPHIPGNIGTLGWNSETEILAKSAKGIYILSPEKSIEILKNDERTAFRGVNFNYDDIYIKSENVLIIGQNLMNNKETIYQLGKGNHILNPVHSIDAKFYSIKRGKRGGDYMVRTMTFVQYPDIYITNNLPEKGNRLTHLDNQRSQYRWGTVKRVFWTSYDGTELSGLVYLPEDIDTTKEYPAIVYFYELYTQREHNFYSPKPSASVINPTEYVSNGYVVFMPDIRYKEGFPAQSAYDAIMSGTDYLLENYTFVDSTKLGLQGQSWGGYQTAQMITMTNRYAAGMAGAPVSNMYSAYGGIRWGSGLSREFQYERTQSRIGGTIWDSTASYMANSPIFGLPNVTTPLLIMHNDNDGAVPWYQGIEMFMGLRRLNKPVWMLVYNGEEHNLMQRRNRKDLSIRMMQFFDVYLKGKNMPNWMNYGVKRDEKGKDFNWQYELSE